MKRVIAFLGLLSVVVMSILAFVANAGPARASSLMGQSISKGNEPDACAYAWRTVASPNGGASVNYLSDLAAITPSDIWAVGYYNNGDRYNTLVEHWNGTSWAVIPSPNVGNGHNLLYAVEAVSYNDIWAVGYQTLSNNIHHNMIQHWNGSTWSVVSSPGSDAYSNELRGVDSVSSNNVYAVGYQLSANSITRTLIQHWNGSTWTTMSSPNTGGFYSKLYDVTVVSSTDIWAVGAGSQDTLTEHWNGSTWSIVASPNIGSQSDLYSVEALSSDDIWAVGTSYTNATSKTLIEHWNGASWVLVTSPNVGATDNGLYGVSIWGSSDVWAVGYSRETLTNRTLIEHWNGTNWTVIPGANVGSDNNFLEAVATLSSGNIWAVGFYSSSATTVQTLVQRYSIGCDTPTPTPTATSAPPTATKTATPSSTPTSTTTATATTTASSPTSTPTLCSIQFTDVDPSSTFYASIRCLACRGIISGYADGTFRPGNLVTRGQIAKIVSNAAGFSAPQSNQTFEDIPTNHTFYVYIERLAHYNIISGYPCGGAGEPCGPDNKPYFRPGNTATRAQLAKIVVGGSTDTKAPTSQLFADVPPEHTFYTEISFLYELGSISGYPCGGPGEPCGAGNLPYFRPGANVSRGQTAKIVSNTFFPNCQTP